MSGPPPDPRVQVKASGETGLASLVGVRSSVLRAVVLAGQPEAPI